VINVKVAIGAALVGAAALGATIAAFSNAQTESTPTTSSFDAAEEDAIREIVRNYLLDNPDVLINSLNTYAAKERAEAEARTIEDAKANLQALLDDKYGFTAGANPAAATVAVVELFDYHCGYCKRAAGLVQDLTKNDPTVKVVFREFPILRQESDYAAQVALAARAQGKYADLHFAMMNATGVLTKERIQEIAVSKGVDFNAIEEALGDPAINESINATHQLASDLAIDGTPAFIIASLNGDFVDVLPGFDAQRLNEAIAEAKKAAKKKG
jgi:protein-disulfide isomerase